MQFCEFSNSVSVIDSLLIFKKTEPKKHTGVVHRNRIMERNPPSFVVVVVVAGFLVLKMICF